MGISKTLALAVSLAVLSGCIAPLTSNFSGRTMGKGKMGFDAGTIGLGDGQVGALKLTYGIAHDFDFGVQLEYGCIGLFGKYALRNPRENGLAFAALFGGGATTNGTYAYTGPVLSFKMNMLEPYIVGRYNYVHYQEMEGIWSGAILESENHSYFQLTVGSIFWISRKIGFNIELSFFSESEWLDELEQPIVAGGLKIRF